MEKVYVMCQSCKDAAWDNDESAETYEQVSALRRSLARAHGMFLFSHEGDARRSNAPCGVCRDGTPGHRYEVTALVPG